MTFDSRERSPDLGSPIELYDFVIGLEHFRYTSSDATFVFSGETFTKAQIERSQFEETDELTKSDLTLTVARDFAIADQFRVAPPSYVVLLNLYRTHDGDTERNLIWTGRVLNASWEGVRATLYCENLMTAMQRPLLRRVVSRQCMHVLYGNRCKVVNTAHKVETSVFTFAGTTVEVTAGALSVQPDGYYAGGYVELELSPGRLTKRTIISQVGDVLTISHPIPDLEATADIDVFPGCDHLPATCNTKFANKANYGGQENMPRRNPFGGSAL